MIDLNEFIEWSRNNPWCQVDIQIGGYHRKDAGKFKIWVYSYNLQAGQYVSSVDEIDLEAEYKKDMERKKREVENYFQQAEKVQVM